MAAPRREIVDPALRRLAVEAQQTKRDSVDGAIAFATFVPRASRQLAIRALTAYQVAFDYIDTISEQPSPDPIANGYRLNTALLDALEADAAGAGAPGAGEASAAERAHHPDYYAHHSRATRTPAICGISLTPAAPLWAGSLHMPR